ncbi:DUF4179 domain-containing protein [Sinanaerobacter chloroacetimidivorans]|uniref:DUF4179 domain-containing protein n=1 Tax=Sinanaerobacter chloroacetimidivorans TaxID=2818044 RepID=A0A8J7VWS5_9FIRM|nr:DUF4179 domain-containing protein [Sinanaerobacter chloroacetimidivorans]MBR0596474.1 DUF4179 domain-containing protein [Sinanaerobacter chloroacetimidivorans]
MSKNRNNISDNSVKILNGLDDLNMEETETLLSGINKVTLSPDEEMLLKAKVLERVGAGELGMAQEVERKTEIGKRAVHSKNRIYMRRAVACIAAVMVCSIVAIAAANMDGLQRFWGSDTEIYRDRALETVQSVQNDNVKINIEGIVSDNYQCVFVFSMEALTEEGRKMIKKYNNKHMVLDLGIKPTMIAGAEDQGMTGIFQYTDDNKDKNYKAYQCDFQLENVDLTKPVTVEFAGLTMRFNIPQYMQVITLYPDSEAGFESVDLSPIGYYYKDAEYAEEVRLIKKDGTLDDELGYFGSMAQENSEEVTVIGSFTRLIDLNEYLGIQIDGINYTAK